MSPLPLWEPILLLPFPLPLKFPRLLLPFPLPLKPPKLLLPLPLPFKLPLHSGGTVRGVSPDHTGGHPRLPLTARCCRHPMQALTTR